MSVLQPSDALDHLPLLQPNMRRKFKVSFKSKEQIDLDDSNVDTVSTSSQESAGMYVKCLAVLWHTSNLNCCVQMTSRQSTIECTVASICDCGTPVNLQLPAVCAYAHATSAGVNLHV